jgi:D-3-phosphoglycerate dehydrogenase
MRIAITDGLHPDALDLLRSAGATLLVEHHDPEALASGALDGVDAIIVRSATKLTSDVIHATPTLRVIGRAGVGVDNIDLSAATLANVRVVNAPGASTRSVVELTIGHLIASARLVAPSDRALRDGRWMKKQATGSEIAGKRLGLVGYGRIARGVAQAATALGMEVHAYDPYLPQGVDIAPAVRLHSDLDSLFSTCTHISLHCNLTEESRHLANAARFALMPGVGADGVACGNHVVNCARGGLVSEEDAAAALESGVLASLALDVFEHEPLAADHPLLSHDRFLGTPHIGASTLEAQRRVGLDIVDAVLRTLETGTCPTVVNRDVL